VRIRFEPTSKDPVQQRLVATTVSGLRAGAAIDVRGWRSDSARLVESIPGLRARRPGGPPFEPAANDTLPSGTTVETDGSGSAELEFPDGSTAAVGSDSRLELRFSSRAARSENDVRLDQGMLEARNSAASVWRSSFKVQTPLATATTTGGRLTATHDPNVGVSVIEAIEKTVVVEPKNKRLKPVKLKPGQTARITRKGIEPPAAP
jgi:ferric-dicitrate binding protein FerR (iron transport regulator)